MEREQAAIWISEPRLGPYLAASDGDFELAIEIYLWNTALNSACMETVAHVEVLLRNATDRCFQYKHSELEFGWLNAESEFTDRSATQISDAVARIEQAKKQPHRARIVAALSFGFWTAMYGKPYQALWDADLHQAFPYGDGRRKSVARELHAINSFRNRAAHHESIFALDLAGFEERCVKVAGWIDPEAAAWIQDQSRVTELSKNDPRG